MRDGRASRLVVLGALVVALVGAFTLGWLLSPDDPAPQARPQAQASSPGPTGQRDGVPVGFARTREGAVAAASAYTAVLSSPVVLDEPQRARAIRVMATPEYAEELIGQLAAVPVGPTGDDPALYQSVQIGYRVPAWSRDAAEVTLWAASLTGDDALTPAQLGFGTSTYALRWLDGDWKLAGLVSNREGPTPRLATERSAPGEVLELARSLRSFRVAP
jgi:hypothetical protein